ncbi:MAG: hypothetical protein ACRENS_01240 [Candidatus Eiseniibacteriota bacterium]
MSYTTEFIDDGRGLIHTATGVLSGEELIAGALRARAELERGGRLEYGLTDLSAVTEMRVKPEDLRRLAEEQSVTSKLMPKAIAAVVAPSDHIFGLARMWEAYADETGWTTRVFRDRPSAEEWLRETVAARRTEAERLSGH